MENNEIRTRLDILTGNMLGLQTLLLSIVATSAKRDEIIRYFEEEARHTHATLIADPGMSDEVLHQLEQWYATTLTALQSEA
ncbi:hypothetical protein PWG14_25380 [Chromobacterium amazonense]|uniref:hypothetical protein n=1 Tax=Chromobacterium amazonense TaxID=1382803 RepID=UPI00237DF2E6|nr:hypothetical protein [Chromobacterium amazonense]MDE1715804.1 hypothetical protein [Chromobacterium amazonense]